MTLAETAGLDVWRCEFCDKKVRKDRPYFTAMDGMRAHNACVDRYRKRERAADRREAAELARMTRPAERIEWTHEWLLAHLSNGL